MIALAEIPHTGGIALVEDYLHASIAQIEERLQTAMKLSDDQPMPTCGALESCNPAHPCARCRPPASPPPPRRRRLGTDSDDEEPAYDQETTESQVRNSRIVDVRTRLGQPVQGEVQAKALWDGALLDQLVGDQRAIRWETVGSLNGPMRYDKGSSITRCYRIGDWDIAGNGEYWEEKRGPKGRE